MQLFNHVAAAQHVESRARGNFHVKEKENRKRGDFVGSDALLMRGLIRGEWPLTRHLDCDNSYNDSLQPW